MAKPLHAFTLVELLAVVAIVLVMLALLFPVYSKLRAASQDLQCVSHLRQIGMAIPMYAADHDGDLPGPLFGSTTATISTIYGGGGLVMSLAPYLGPYPRAARPYTVSPDNLCSPLFECPAAKSIVMTQCTNLDGFISYQNGSNNDAFGYPATMGWEVKLPKRLAAIPASSTVAVKDCDQLVAYSGNSHVAARMAHGSHRNTLYFDGHVQAGL